MLECSRSKSKEALVDHTTSAHGQYRIVKPKWAAAVVCEEDSGNKADATVADANDLEPTYLHSTCGKLIMYNSLMLIIV